MAQTLSERYRERLYGVLSCFDRIVIMGTLPGVCYAAGMTSSLYAKGIHFFDYARFAAAAGADSGACAAVSGAGSVQPALPLEPDAARVLHGSHLPLRGHPGPLYEQLSRQAGLAVKAEQVGSFLGKKITAQLAQEIGSCFATASKAPV